MFGALRNVLYREAQAQMATEWFYLSIVKGRPAEYGALVELDSEAAKLVTPLIQLWPGVAHENHSAEQLWPDDGEDDVARNLIRQLLEKVAGIWADDRPVLLDGDWLANTAAFRGVLDTARAFGRRPLPVTGLARSDAYQTVVAESVAHDHQGCVLRLVRSDFTEGFLERLETFIARVGLAPGEVDILLDLRVLDDRRHLERDEVFAASMIKSLPYLADWRNLALAASSAPASARNFPYNDMEPYPRLEWWLWQLLSKHASALGRLPIYADYGVIHPDRVEESDNPRALPRIPQIRITGGNECLLVRGLNLNTNTPDHLPPLLLKLMGRQDWWCGDGYSAAERWIAGVARDGSSIGNATVWKRVGMVHHWTFVTRQLARPFAP